ncbi:hypothetical protein VNI00_003971 [Paramarasmius palmivorus]|uniref:F-box domain-containing protein n=1 Tax=Paramarasmius palmivorus TaxID=297713 RepID=A0AAW0DND3_9AGAR
MGQYFYFVNFDKPLLHCSLGKYGEWFGLDDDYQVIKFLKRLVVPPPEPKLGQVQIAHRRERHDYWKYRLGLIHSVPGYVKNRFQLELPLTGFDRAGSEYATLLDLPLELHTAIFDLLDGYGTALNLAVVNRHFWNVGKARLTHFLARTGDTFCWAGDRIIFIGDGSEDLPEHIENPPGDEDCITIEEIKDEVQYESRSPDWPSLPKVYQNDGLPTTKEFKPWVKPYEQSSTVWVLRNLSKKEYTYAVKRSNSSRRGYGTFADRLSVWAVWASNGISGVDDKYARGRWAGDCFDIVPEEQLKYVIGKDGKAVEEDGWRDVTEELNQVLDVILA